MLLQCSNCRNCFSSSKRLTLSPPTRQRLAMDFSPVCRELLTIRRASSSLSSLPPCSVLFLIRGFPLLPECLYTFLPPPPSVPAPLLPLPSLPSFVRLFCSAPVFSCGAFQSIPSGNSSRARSGGTSNQASNVLGKGIANFILNPRIKLLILFSDL